MAIFSVLAIKTIIMSINAQMQNDVEALVQAYEEAKTNEDRKAVLAHIRDTYGADVGKRVIMQRYRNSVKSTPKLPGSTPDHYDYTQEEINSQRYQSYD